MALSIATSLTVMPACLNASCTAAAQRWGALDAKLGKLALVVPLAHEKDVFLYGKNVKNAVPDGWRGTYDLARVSVK